ncbi:MAG: ATP-binding protein [Methanoregula sp.]|uniref:ATP-binding protein n=1 Tax=Methanoregula sp. TaxID=2052170 RepID=UPI003D1092D6
MAHFHFASTTALSGSPVRMMRGIFIQLSLHPSSLGYGIVDFCTTFQKNFNIVYAGTGTGKTTFLDAISWCLYGKEPHKKLPRETLLNKITDKELKTRDTADVIVEIVLGEDDDNLDFHFQRRLSFIKNKEGSTVLLHHPISSGTNMINPSWPLFLITIHSQLMRILRLRAFYRWTF